MKVIQLTQGQVAIVDDEDFAEIAQYRWQWSAKGAKRTQHIPGSGKANRKQIALKMHRVIMGVTDPKVYVDHINGNPMDNRRENLRLATHAQNGANSKVSKNNALGVKGVAQRGARFRAHITVNRKIINLGTFNTAEEASQKYFETAQKHFGEFARKN